MKIQSFDFSANLLEALLWQYNDATKLQSILQQKQDWYNINYTNFWQDWYNNVFNLATANDFGLGVWAKILDISFALPPAPTRNNNLFGYTPYANNYFNSNYSPSGGDNASLSTEQKRIVLQLTYLKYVSRGTVPDINNILTSFFGFKVYILDSLNMTGTIIFTKHVNSSSLQILTDYNLIPRPAAVKVNYLTVTTNQFGYSPYGNNYYQAYYAN
jgi:hypothetical protein